MMEANETTALLQGESSGKIKPVCIITGSNSGIGLKAAEALASSKHGFHVVLACRNEQRARGAADTIRTTVPGATVTPMLCDLSSLSSVRKFVDEYRRTVGKTATLRLIVCNAGLGDFPGYRTTTFDGFELHMGVNYIGHFLLVNLLLPDLKNVKPEARIVIVSSSLHDPASTGGSRPPITSLHLDDLQLSGPGKYNGELAYRNSKLAMVLWAYELQRRANAMGYSNVVVQAMHPGFIPETGFIRHHGCLLQLMLRTVATFCASCIPIFRTTDEGAECIVQCCVDEKAGVPHGGHYWEISRDGEFRQAFSSAESYDENTAKKLWELTAKLVTPELMNTDSKRSIASELRI